MEKLCPICKMENCICKQSSLNSDDVLLIKELDSAIENLENFSKSDHLKNEELLDFKINNDKKSDPTTQKKDNVTSKDSYYAIFIDGLVNSNEKIKFFEIIKNEGIDGTDKISTQLNDSRILIKGLNQVKAYLIASKFKNFNCKVDVSLESEIISSMAKSDISKRLYSPLDSSKSVLLYTIDALPKELSYKYVSYISENMYVNVDTFSDDINLLENKLRIKAYDLAANAVLGLKFNFIDTTTGLYAFICGTAVKVL